MYSYVTSLTTRAADPSREGTSEAALALRRPERRELVRHLEPLRREAEERRGAPARPAGRADALNALELATAHEHALQVRRRDVVAERRDVDQAQLRHREGRRPQGEPDVRGP